jgi:hypothetical protein
LNDLLKTNKELSYELDDANLKSNEVIQKHIKEITMLKATIDGLTLTQRVITSKLTQESNSLKALIQLEIGLSDVLRWDTKWNKGRIQTLLLSALQTLAINHNINDIFRFEITTIFWRIEAYSDSKTHTSDGHWVAQLVKGYLSFDEMLATCYSKLS